jgi:hypothetical protein
MEVPLTIGRWGKPKCLHDAKFDFLVLDATVISTNNPAKFHTFGKLIQTKTILRSICSIQEYNFPTESTNLY